MRVCGPSGRASLVVTCALHRVSAEWQPGSDDRDGRRCQACWPTSGTLAGWSVSCDCRLGLHRILRDAAILAAVKVTSFAIRRRCVGPGGQNYRAQYRPLVILLGRTGWLLQPGRVDRLLREEVPAGRDGSSTSNTYFEYHACLCTSYLGSFDIGLPC